MSDATRRVQCQLHSETPATFVCRHLRSGVGCGFHCSSEDSSDPWPDAWCDACEAAFERDGDWNDDNEPDIQLLCTGCYESVRERNSYVPPPIVPGQVVVTAPEFAALAHGAYERCKRRQKAVQKKWPLFSKGSWRYDSEARIIRFFDDPLGEVLLADVTVAGSFSTRTNTWMWVWANGHYRDAHRADMDPMRVFGEVRGIEKLSSGHWPGQEVDGWEVTQIAADLLGADAVYRAPADHMFLFMLLKEFRSVYPV